MIWQIPRGDNICSHLYGPCPVVGKGSISLALTLDMKANKKPWAISTGSLLGFSQLRHHQSGVSFNQTSALAFSHMNPLWCPPMENTFKNVRCLTETIYSWPSWEKGEHPLPRSGKWRLTMGQNLSEEQLILPHLPPCLHHDEKPKSHETTWNSVNSKKHLSNSTLWLLLWLSSQRKALWWYLLYSNKLWEIC